MLILYFSGVGVTEEVAKLIKHHMSGIYAIEMNSVEEMNNCSIDDYDALIIGTPVYHAAPAKILIDYFSNIKPLAKDIPAFIYNTRALCSCNTNRILSMKIRHKNIITAMDRSYRGPATDGVLLLPFVGRFWEYEKDLEYKIKNDCNLFSKQLEEKKIERIIPSFSVSSIINAPNKLAGTFTAFRIYLHEDKCIKCGKCIKNCPYNAFGINHNGYPKFMRESCENCYRCIHHCPSKALSLNKRNTYKQLLG